MLLPCMRFPQLIFLVMTALSLVACHELPPAASSGRYVPTEAERAAWPKTVDEAVTRLLAEMNDAEKAELRATKKEELIMYHMGWGVAIRNEFGLWKGNTELMADCHKQHPDDASGVIIEAVWQKLQQP